MRILFRRVGGRLERNWTPEATHLVVWDVPENRRVQRSTKYALALLAGIWIVTFDWVAESCQQCSWATEEPHEVIGDTCILDAQDIPKTARLAKAQAGAAMSLLFHGWQVFLADSIQGLQRADMLQILQVAGATIITEPPPAASNTKQTVEREQAQILLVCNPTDPGDDAEVLFLSTSIHPVCMSHLLFLRSGICTNRSVCISLSLCV